MEATLVGAVVGASIQVLLQSLLMKAIEEINLRGSYKKEMKKLKGELDMIRAYLSDAEKLRVQKESVKLWLNRLECVAFKAYTVLDKINYHRLQAEVENLKKRKFTSFFLPLSSNPIVFRSKMARKIREINEELKAVNETAKSYGLHTTDLAAQQFSLLSVQPSGRETNSFIVEPIVVGRENDLSTIVEMLVTASVFSVIPIVGMGGLGKTTLARKIFNHERIKSHFDKKIWVCLPEPFNAVTLFKMILESLTGQICGSSQAQVVLENIKNVLGSQKCLLILDDMWSDDSHEWDEFMGSLQGITSVKGSGIIVTTRKRNVAEMVKTLPCYQLRSLSDDECWSIIRAKAFKGGDVPAGFGALGKRIAQKCKGLPLAAKVVGGLLNGKSREEWQKILETQLSYSREDENNIMNILKLSFDRLPSSSLKKCFAYCSIFPQDFQIDREQLIQMWMAEGFLQPDQGNDMEAVGEDFFYHLLQNSLFEDARRDEYGNVTRCKMHDLVHDLACAVSGTKNSGSTDIHPFRYLSWNSSRDGQFKISQKHAKHLRTLCFEGTVEENMFSKFRCLHVLKLEGRDITELPREIENLIHLRYLDISNSSLACFPDFVGKLYNLQTLYVGKDFRKRANTITNLINLRYLYISSWQLPPGIGKLTCLRALSKYDVRQEEGCGIGELGSLKNLRGKLKIRNLELVKNKEEAIRADLFGKPNLSHLSFIWGNGIGERNDEDVLEGLQPPQNLKSLEIGGYKAKNFALWTIRMAVRNGISDHWVELNNLIDIQLRDCLCEEIPMLGQLPHLKSVVLIHLPNVKNIGLTFYGIASCNASNNIFPALKRLTLWMMPSLTEWVDLEVATTIFPCLEDLEIQTCPRLTSVPSHFTCLETLTFKGVDSCLPLTHICDGNLSSLKELEVRGVPDLISLPDGLFVKNQNLNSLSIENCPNLTHLVPGSLGGGASLEFLKILRCKNLRELPNDLHRLQSLKELTIIDCPKLKSIPYQSSTGEAQAGLISLQELEIENCRELTTLPLEVLEHCGEQFRSFKLRNLPNLTNPSEVIGCLPKMTHLSYLEVCNLPKLMNFPLECNSLSGLSIGQFSDSLDIISFYDILHGIFQVSQSLREVSLYGKECWEFLPDQLQHLTALESLSLYDFGSIEVLPEWLGNFSSLWDLRVTNCKKLRDLPSKETIQRLTNLRDLSIIGCPLVKEKYSETRRTFDSNSVWSKDFPSLSVYIR